MKDLPNNTACGSEKSLCPVGILLNRAEQIKNGVKEGNKKILLVARLHCVDGAIPCVKDTFPQ